MGNKVSSSKSKRDSVPTAKRIAKNKKGSVPIAKSIATSNKCLVPIPKSKKATMATAKRIAKSKKDSVPIATRKKGGSVPIAKRKKAPIGNQADRQKSEQSLALERSPCTKEEVWKKLEPCQRAAMRHVDSQAKSLHGKALPALLKRALLLGFTHADLDSSLVYIRDEAPIVVHLGAETLALLCKDPWYRSQFETGTSKGVNDRAQRQQWENLMFANAYASAKDGEHPKYGCLNITGDIRGVCGARGYGELFMTLAPAVRHRTSFSNGIKPYGSVRVPMATNDWFRP